MVTYQLGNTFFIMSMMAFVVLWSSSEARVVKRYLWALAIGDVGHLFSVWWFSGSGYFFGVSQWNALAGGSIGFTTFLLLTRIVTLMGGFGDIGEREGKVKVK